MQIFMQVHLDLVSLVCTEVLMIKAILENSKKKGREHLNSNAILWTIFYSGTISNYPFISINILKQALHTYVPTDYDI